MRLWHRHEWTKWQVVWSSFWGIDKRQQRECRTCGLKEMRWV